MNCHVCNDALDFHGPNCYQAVDESARLVRVCSKECARVVYAGRMMFQSAPVGVLQAIHDSLEGFAHG